MSKGYKEISFKLENFILYYCKIKNLCIKMKMKISKQLFAKTPYSSIYHDFY